MTHARILGGLLLLGAAALVGMPSLHGDASGQIPAQPLAGADRGDTPRPCADDPRAVSGSPECLGDTARRLGDLQAAFDQYLIALRRPRVEFPLARGVRTKLPRGPQPEFWSAEDARRYRIMEKVIDVARQLPEPPEIPDAARRALTRGDTALRAATNVRDFDRALDEFRGAVDLAPWWPRALLGVSLLSEEFNNHTDALNSLKLYQRAAPDSDPQEVRDKINELERKRRA